MLTKQDFHFTNMHLAYKTGFSFYKYASRLQSVAFRFTNGTLGLQFIVAEESFPDKDFSVMYIAEIESAYEILE